MTAKEKAQDLIQKMSKHVNVFGGDTVKLSIVAVDEIN